MSVPSKPAPQCLQWCIACVAAAIACSMLTWVMHEAKHNYACSTATKACLVTNAHRLAIPLQPCTPYSRTTPPSPDNIAQCVGG